MDTTPVQQAADTTTPKWTCPKCGKEWSTAWSKCSKCGTPQPVKQISAAELGLSQQEYNFYNWTRKYIVATQMEQLEVLKSLNSKLGFIVAVVIIGIIIQVLAAIFR